MRLNGQIKNPVFNAGTTYVVEENVMFSLSVVIPENVTLIFQGGKFVVADDCTEEITIIGTNTRLEAPVCNIFGKGINVTGSWNIERAYPQWFEIEREIISTEHIMIDSDGNDIFENFRYVDWSAPINKAIKMKQIGEVFLKNEGYSIASPITMNSRIQLVGESAQWGDVKKVLNKETNNEGYESIYGCTRIFPVAEGKAYYDDKYLLYVNVDPTTETTALGMTYIDQSTLIKNICFTDWIKKEKTKQPAQKCILAGGGVHLDSIVWYNFLQGVKYTDTYNDTRSIINCSFKTDRDDNNKSEDYAFDTGWLGDALKFEHNAIHSTCNGKGLRLSNCAGASIQGNIINSDVLIVGCKAVVFNANHCESGIQVEIIDSSVTTNNNFFEKGTRPNISIHNSDYGDKSVVSMNNDMFMMYNFPRFSIESIQEMHLDKNEKDMIKDLLTSFHNQINNISESDIRIDKNTILNINDTYRYEFGDGTLGKMYPFGIKIEKNEYPRIDLSGNTTYHPFEEFNKYSYIASCNSKILSGYKLNIQATINEINAPRLNCSQKNENVKWLGENGTYRYYYQIVWDKDREIMKTTSSTNTSENTNPINWYPEQVNMSNDVEKTTDENSEQISFTFSPGVLLDMSEDTNGNCAMVRLIREKVNDNSNSNQLEFKFQDVYVPVCGSRYLYDNGISVCGYKWSDPFQFLLLETSDKNMEMLRIIDGNVECFTKREGGITPTSGWKRGDVIHNISNNPSTYIVPDDID